ncbi:MAG: ATP-binding protein [Candidatus Babeliales bacterium]
MIKTNLLLMFIIILTGTCFCQPLKIVFTGGPCIGKTTLINALANKGYSVVAEAGTAVITEEKKKGNLEPWRNLEQFQLAILKKQLDFFYPVLTSNANIVFLDRAIPDGLAHFYFHGKTPPAEIVALSKAIKYDYVFVLEPLPVFESNGIRRETPQEARKLHALLSHIYQTKLGYNIPIINVPVLTVDERIEFVLNKLREFKAIP